MARKAMHQTTVRFGSDLWSALEAEATRLGISTAQYVRDAALVRLTYTEGVKHGSERSSPWAEIARADLARDVVEALDSSAAVRVQGELARRRAAQARAQAQRLRNGRRMMTE